MSKPWWHIILISVIALLITLIVLLLFYPVPEAPSSELKKAREALSAARGNEAGQYSEDIYIEAIACYDSAMANWSRENKKPFYKRDFSKAAAFAELSEKEAHRASETAINRACSLKVFLEKELRELDLLIQNVSTGVRYYPLTAELRNNISLGRMTAIEARLAFNEKRYIQSAEAAERSKELLNTSGDKVNSGMQSWFRSYPLWRKWIDSTLAASKENNDYTIIVDKFAHKLFVYLDGEKISEFTAELGENWLGNKRRRGDKATPEGMYRIVKIIVGDSTLYYKALLLDYPNPEDTVRFRREIEKGTLPRRASPGDNIQIHGSGGRGADWTSGCIALKDREMDSVFSFVKVGTPVTIVGSMNNIRNLVSR